MKKIINITLSLLVLLSLGACTEWLDVNDNPNNPSSTVPTVDQRLQSIQSNFVDSYESSGTRGSWVTGHIAKTGGNTYNDFIVRWNPKINSTTWPYQAWFIYTACNLEPLINKATEEGAYHYIGAAQVIHAWGFMTMTDVYGEMPYTDAMTSSITPVYDDGKTIFMGCLDMIEKAIENLSKSQEPGVTPLSAGDAWNRGNTDTWLKLAYGLKARWLNNLSKKASYDPDAILAALEKGPQSVADNTVMRYINTDMSDRASALRSLQHGNVGSTTSRVTKYYADILTNSFDGGTGIIDPRADLLLPSGQYEIDGKIQYVRAVGVDMINSDIRTMSGPTAFDIMAVNLTTGKKFTSNADKKDGANFKNKWYTNSTLPYRQGDSIYTPIYSELNSWIKDGEDKTDDRYIAHRYNGMDKTVVPEPRIISTGTFYTRADGPGHLLCYHEMCFIKAEVLFRKGDKGGAVTAYKEGIRAHMEAMNVKLAEYDQNIFGKQVIPASEIDKYLASDAVAQSAGEITIADIMRQKYIALSFSLQAWNDMRRMDYGANRPIGVAYPGFDRPYEFDAAAAECYPTSNKDDERYWMRRFQQCSHEVNYNKINLEASNPEAFARTIVSMPVWWDSAAE